MMIEPESWNTSGGEVLVNVGASNGRAVLVDTGVFKTAIGLLVGENTSIAFVAVGVSIPETSGGVAIIVFWFSALEQLITDSNSKKQTILLARLIFFTRNHLQLRVRSVLARPLPSLHPPETGVNAVQREQVFVATLFAQLSIFKHEDYVGIADGGQPVGDDDGRPSHDDFLQ